MSAGDEHAGSARSGEFRLSRCGLPGAFAVTASSRRRFARHMHEHFGIGLIEAGGQLSHSGRGQVEAGPGDVITVNPGEVHDGSPVGDVGRSWRIIYLEPQVVGDAALDVLGVEAGRFELTRPVLSDSRVGDSVRRLLSTAWVFDDPLTIEQSLLSAIAAVGLDRSNPSRTKLGAEVAAVRTMIDDDPAAEITLTMLAQVAGLGRFQLLRAFARATGLTPHAYIVQRRVEVARRLIIQGDSLAGAAESAGFSDQSHMTRAFASRYGVTPGAFAAAWRPLTR